MSVRGRDTGGKAASGDKKRDSEKPRHREWGTGVALRKQLSPPSLCEPWDRTADRKGLEPPAAAPSHDSCHNLL